MTQALETEVNSRYGGANSEYLIGLTRNFSRGFTTSDSAQLQRAVNDVYAAFKIYGGVVYDDSSASNPDHYDEHIMVGVVCVIAKLRAYTGQGAAAGELDWDACVKFLKSMAQIGARDRFAMLTSSGLTTSVNNPNGEVVRPEFDETRFAGYVPNDTPGTNTSTGPTTGW